MVVPEKTGRSRQQGEAADAARLVHMGSSENKGSED
jgi:hypothetical protein